MTSRILILCFAFSSLLFSVSGQTPTIYQLQDTSLGPSLSGTLFETSPGAYDLIGAGSFSFDSSYLNLIALDTAFNAGAHNSFSLSGLAIFNDAEPTIDGYLLGGSNFGQAISFPFLIKTDANFAVEWAHSLGNLAISQTHVVKIFSDSTRFTAYSYSSPANTVVHRITGNIDGTNIVAHSIENANNRFRFYDGIRSGGPETHILGGKIENQLTNETDALIAAWDDNGWLWHKVIDFGASGTEDFANFTEPVFGQFLATASNFNTDSSRFETFLCSMDTAGSINWVQKISLSTGNANLTGVVQLPNGDIFLAGLTNNLEATLIKLAPDASLIWSKKWIWPDAYWTSIQDLFLNEAGQLVIQLGHNGEVLYTELDPTDASCNFEEGPDILIEPYSLYTVSTITPFPAPLSPTLGLLPLSSRQLGLETTVFCVDMATDLESALSEENWKIYPVPTRNQLRIEANIQHPAVARIQILNYLGQVVGDQAYADLLEIGHLPAGWYALHIRDGQQVRSKIFQKE